MPNFPRPDSGASRSERYLRFRFAFFLLALSISLITGCSSDHESAQESLKLGYVPSEITVSDRRGAFEALRNYLEEQLDMPVELVQTADYNPAINAMKDGEIDLINFAGSYAYLIAERNASAEAFALRGEPNGKPRTYECFIITPADRPWNSIDDALQMSERLNVLYTNKASTSSFLIANSFYRSKGLDPETDFAAIGYSNSHVLSILQISEGEYDLASISGSFLRDLVSQGKVAPDSIRVLWKSEPIPSGPVAYRKSLDPEIKAAIQRAFYTAHLSDSAIWDRIKAQSPNRPFIYIPVYPGAFESLKKLTLSGSISVPLEL